MRNTRNLCFKYSNIPEVFCQWHLLIMLSSVSMVLYFPFMPHGFFLTLNLPLTTDHLTLTLRKPSFISISCWFEKRFKFIFVIYLFCFCCVCFFSHCCFLYILIVWIWMYDLYFDTGIFIYFSYSCLSFFFYLSLLSFIVLILYEYALTYVNI